MATVQARRKQYDQARRELLNQLETLRLDTLKTRPQPDKWSIIEIIQHLVLAETHLLRTESGTSNTGASKRTLRHRFLYAAVLFVLRFGIPVKTPSRKVVPSGDPSLSELQQQWDASQSWLQSFVANLDRRARKKAAFKHPIAGPMTAKQTIRFLHVHFDTHARQIRRILDRRPDAQKTR